MTIRTRFFGLAALAARLLTLTLAGDTPAGPNPDHDHDGVFDLVDNCLEQINGDAGCCGPGRNQLDTDQDGFGQVCDADFNNSNTINITDYQ